MKIIAVVLILLAASPAFATDNWIGMRSPNFILLGDATERQMRDVAENLELFRAAVGRLLPAVVADARSGATMVFVFRNEASFRPFQPLYEGRPRNVAGYFLPGPDTAFIALTGDIRTPRVVYHEYVHLLTDSNVASDLPWFNEGIAEYYSTMELSGRDRKIRAGSPIGEHILLLRERPMLSLDALLSVTLGSADYQDREKAETFYAQSWALTHYLIHGENGRYGPGLSRLIQLLYAGSSVVEGFRLGLGVEIPEFQRGFERYLNLLAWPAVEYTFADALSIESGAEIIPMPPAQAALHAGNLLLYSPDRFNEAESYLRKAIDLDPSLAAAHAALGVLGMRRNDETAAYASLQRAVRLDGGRVPASALAMYENLLRRDVVAAVRENPDSAEAVLRAALNDLPENDGLWLLLAEVMLQSRKFDEAEPILQRLVDRGAPQLAARDRERAVSHLEGIRLQRIMTAERAAAQSGQARATAQPGASPAVIPIPPPRIAGETVMGLLTLFECSNGVRLTVEVGGQAVQFHSADASRLQVDSATPDIKEFIDCGPMPRLPVRVTYRPDPSGATFGEPLHLLFLGSNGENSGGR